MKLDPKTFPVDCTIRGIVTKCRRSRRDPSMAEPQNWKRLQQHIKLQERRGGQVFVERVPVEDGERANVFFRKLPLT